MHSYPTCVFALCKCVFGSKAVTLTLNHLPFVSLSNEYFCSGILAQALPPPSSGSKMPQSDDQKGFIRGGNGKQEVEALRHRLSSGAQPLLSTVSSNEGLLVYLRGVLNDQSIEEKHCQVFPVDFHCRCSKSNFCK